MPDVPDTTIPLLKGILVNLGGASSEGAAPDTRTQILQKIVQTLGVSVAATADTELSLLRQWIVALGIAYDAAIQTEVEALTVLYVAYGGADDATTPDHEIPLLKGIYNLTTSSIFDDVAFWRANSGVTGNPVTAWASGLNSLTAAGGARPTVGTDFLPATSIVFDGTANIMSLSPGPLTSTTGTLAMVFKTGSLGSTRCLICGSSDNEVSFIDVLYTSGGVLQIIYQVNPSGPTQVAGSTVLSANTEYQLMISCDGSSFSVWIDGVAESMSTILSGSGFGWFGNAPAPRSLYAGARNLFGIGSGFFFNGSLGVIWAWDTVLSSAQRTQVFDYLYDNWLATTVSPWLMGDNATPWLMGDNATEWALG